MCIGRHPGAERDLSPHHPPAVDSPHPRTEARLQTSSWCEGDRVARGSLALQAEDPAGRAAEQPSRHHQRRGGDRVDPSDGRGARTRGSPRPALFGNVRALTRPRIWTGGPDAWPGDAASGEPEARWIEAENSRPHRRGAASPYCGLTAPRLAPRRRRSSSRPPQEANRSGGSIEGEKATRAMLEWLREAAKTAAKPRGDEPGRRFGTSYLTSIKSAPAACA